MFSFFYNFMTTLSGGKSFEEIRKANKKKINNTIDKKISREDGRVFSSLASRQKNEGFFRHLKRHRQLYALPTEKKQKLISAEKRRVRDEEVRKQNMLQDYIGDSNSSQSFQAQQQSQQAGHDSSINVNVTINSHKQDKGLSR